MHSCNNLLVSVILLKCEYTNQMLYDYCDENHENSFCLAKGVVSRAYTRKIDGDDHLL